jgi:hypothetical protein
VIPEQVKDYGQDEDWLPNLVDQFCPRNAGGVLYDMPGTLRDSGILNASAAVAGQPAQICAQH